jgi:hypothetical protein
MAYKAGRIPKKPYATASSPLEGLIEFWVYLNFSFFFFLFTF